MSIPGERLQQWLDTADISQAELARRLQLDPGTVSRWRHDQSKLRGRHAERVIGIFRELGVHIDLPQVGTRVYLSTPMAALDTGNYETDRSAASPVFDQLNQAAAPVYWPAGLIDSTAGFEAPDLATQRNLAALSDAEAFVYLQLRELTHPTSCHVELGMAIALRKPVTVFAPAEDALPYTLRRFEAISGRIGFGGRYRFYAVRDAADAARLLSIHGVELLGLNPQQELERQR